VQLKLTFFNYNIHHYELHQSFSLSFLATSPYDYQNCYESIPSSCCLFLRKNMARLHKHCIQSCLKSSYTFGNITHFIKPKQTQPKSFKAFWFINSPRNTHSYLQTVIFELIHHGRIVLTKGAAHMMTNRNSYWNDLSWLQTPNHT
jgi:hypothetical protein